MKFTTVALAILLCLFATALASNLMEQVPKIPLYVGRGYNMLQGNPIVNQLDPGFKYPIFQFTYEDQQTTEDGAYLIPDGMMSRQQYACSFSSEVQIFRGTKSYQAVLNSTAQISGTYSGKASKAAFSLSKSFQDIAKATFDTNFTITQTSALCQVYQLTLDIYAGGTVSPSFIMAVKESSSSGNWDNFISQFGTHYVYDGILGGRAVQQISYEELAFSTLLSVGFDVRSASKGQFSRYFGDSSFDWKKYNQILAYADRYSQEIKQMYMGGQPPKDGNVSSWQLSVVKNPKPIYIMLLDIAELFTRLTEYGIDPEKAKTSFHNALDDYCTRKGCIQPTVPDRSAPFPATMAVYRTELIGSGEGGQNFSYQFNSTTVNAKQFFIREGVKINNIQILLSDGIKNQYTPAQGGEDGARSTWSVPDGQYITQVQYRQSNTVDSLTFITNTGEKSPAFGGGGGTYGLMTFPSGFRLIGFYGKSDDLVDQLGFILGRTYFIHAQPSESELRSSFDE